MTFELDPARAGDLGARGAGARAGGGANKLRGMRRMVVKLGSSVVADSDGELRMDVLARVSRRARGRCTARATRSIVVTSGAIARGMRVMDLPQRPSSIGELQAASAVGQGKLYRVYDELLRERGVTSAQVLLTFFDMSARTHYLNARQTLTTLLEWRVLPVINENDTTATDEISFGDNDFLAAQVAVLVGADELVLLTDIDGLYTADPRLHPDAQIVERGRATSPRCAELEIGHTTSPLGSGGMRSKVVAADMATAAGIATVICNGLRAGARCEAVLAGERRGHALRRARGALQQLQAVAEVRQALARHAGRRRGRRARGARGQREPAAGRRRRGARRVRRGRRRRDRRAAPPAASAGARARARASATTPRRSCGRCSGMKSGAVREILPRATEEAVHRDYLVVD